MCNTCPPDNSDPLAASRGILTGLLISLVLTGAVLGVVLVLF